MSPFQGVVTTGIYCRPSCSATPLPKNVRPFESQAAAEAAGFRACLRCRPYRAGTPIGTIGPDLVCRSVALILDGALDDGTEAELGARLGISARHLRRLFVEHVGTTPDQLARSRRAHFARRLLDDSDLSFTDIAFAAGFGSVRQFNRACQEIFRATPSELRARRRKADRLVADGGLLLRLPFEGRLDWCRMLDYFRHRAIPGVEHVDDGTYRRTIEVGGAPGVLEVFAGPDTQTLLLRAHLPDWNGLIHIVERVRRLFALDADPTTAVAALADDPVLGDRVRSRPGLRVPGAWDPFETGVRAIVGQQVSVAGATTLIGRVVEARGRPVSGLEPLGLRFVFPAPGTLVDADLSSMGLTSARCDTIRAFARAVVDEDIRLDRSVPLDELVASLMRIRGVGPWTAHYLALRVGERDAFPAGDLGLRRNVHPPTTASARELETMAERWRPRRALAAIHLWQSTE